MLEDYAFLIQGLLDLYEASFEVEWLSWAIRLQEPAGRTVLGRGGRRLFLDRRRPAGRPGAGEGRLRWRRALAQLRRGDEPAPLWQVTDRKEWREHADAVFAALAVRLTRSGRRCRNWHPRSTSDCRRRSRLSLPVRATPPTPGRWSTSYAAASSRTRSSCSPTAALTRHCWRSRCHSSAPWTRLNGRATIYICQNYACRLPTSDVNTAAALLDAR